MSPSETAFHDFTVAMPLSMLLFPFVVPLGIHQPSVPAPRCSVVIKENNQKTFCASERKKTPKTPVLYDCEWSLIYVDRAFTARFTDGKARYVAEAQCEVSAAAQDHPPSLLLWYVPRGLRIVVRQAV
ncbi:hypothetical protein R6Q59_010011 [Mikania micrantha]